MHKEHDAQQARKSTVFLHEPLQLVNHFGHRWPGRRFMNPHPFNQIYDFRAPSIAQAMKGRSANKGGQRISNRLAHVREIEEVLHMEAEAPTVSPLVPLSPNERALVHSVAERHRLLPSQTNVEDEQRDDNERDDAGDACEAMEEYPMLGFISI